MRKAITFVLALLAASALSAQATGEYESEPNGTGDDSFQLNRPASSSDVTVTTNSVEIGTPDGMGGFTWSDASVKCITKNPGKTERITLNSSTPVPAGGKLRFDWARTGGSGSPFTAAETWVEKGEEAENCPD